MDIEVLDVYLKRYLAECNGEGSVDSAFKAGWRFALEEAERQRNLTRARKCARIDAFAFVNVQEGRPNMSGVFCEKGRQVVTDGVTCLVHNGAEYPEEWEGNVVLKGGHVLADAQFPPFRRIMPFDIDDGRSVDARLSDAHIQASDSPSLEDICVFMPSMKTARIKTLSKMRDDLITIDFGGKRRQRMSMLVVKALKRFLEAYPEAKCFKSVQPGREDVYNPRFLIDRKSGDMLVYMLCKGGDIDSCGEYYSAERRMIVAEQRG